MNTGDSPSGSKNSTLLNTSLQGMACIYIAQKYIFKKHLKKISQCLKSYHILTTFLWFLEDTDLEMWEDEDVKTFEEQNRDTEILVLDDSINLENIPSGHIKSIDEMLKLLLQFTANMLRSGNSPP